MADYVSDILAAERRGRILALMQQPAPGDEWSLDLGHGADACAFMTAARWAARYGASVSIRMPETEDRSQVYQDLLESSRRQNFVAPTQFHSRGDASVLTITQEGGQWEIDTVPDDSLAWRTPLIEAAPLVRPAAATTLRLTASQCRMVDARAIREFLVPGLCLMENAATGAASVATDMMSRTRAVLVLAGGGNNGGDGLALARGLDSLGIRVAVALFKNPEALRGDALVNYHQLEIRPSVRLHYLADRPDRITELLDAPELIVDALLGTGFSGSLSPAFGRAIDAVNATEKPVLALDLPSGMDGETGEVADTAMVCRRTVTFAAMKPGLETAEAAAYTGECYVADIGAPWESLQQTNS